MDGLILVFLILPPLMLFVKEVRRWQASVRSLFGVYVLIGWGMMVVAARMQYEVSQVNDSTQVFMMYLGWVYSAVYYLAWMTASYVIGQFMKQLTVGMDIRL